MRNALEKFRAVDDLLRPLLEAAEANALPTAIRSCLAQSVRTSSVLGQATTQRNQDRGHRESHEAEKRPTESDESTARRQGGMDDRWPDRLPP